MIEKLDVNIRYILYFLIAMLPFSNSAIEICFGLVFALWIMKRLLLKSYKVVPSILNGPIFLYIFVAILSVITSRYFKNSLHAFFTKFMEGIVLYFIIIEAVKQKKHAFVIIALFLLTSIVVAIDGIIQYFFTGFDLFFHFPIVREGMTASFSHANKFAAYLFFPLFMMSGAVIDRVKSGRIDLKLFGLLCAAVILFFVFIFTKSRASWLGLIAALLFFTFYLNRKVFLITAVFVTVIISALAFFLASDSSLTVFRAEQVPLVDTAILRVRAWSDTVNMIKEKPLFGHGINTFMELFQKYRSDPRQEPEYAHNCYLQMAAEMGIAGLMAFLWIIARFFRECANKKNGYVLLGIVSGLLALLVHSFFDTDLYSLQLNILFWFMLGLAIAAQKLDITSMSKNDESMQV